MLGLILGSWIHYIYFVHGFPISQIIVLMMIVIMTVIMRADVTYHPHNGARDLDHPDPPHPGQPTSPGYWPLIGPE